DYYGILGLENTCTPDEINKRYKKLAKLTHPDKNKWPDAELAFQRLSTAHDVLKDPSERRSYD
ncbi:DnaJ domain-containing protein, partial [Leptodontidium sp. 2 PMI_412]